MTDNAKTAEITKQLDEMIDYWMKRYNETTARVGNVDWRAEMSRTIAQLVMA